ncbi:hypothetical protein KGA65_05665 [Ideonella sp. B7]|uniref:hypothetical protein n=1 Tax=Ideonella benzenivorans TaxID=2831643 RepID=UPI001CEC018F|nr:hypothetical protein [Ideonella benzenivorans]MCA6216031.1 hypothetical protein [Ideonella benzenivorans]
MAKELNLANSVFPGLNDKRGILICGYEWGFSLDDQRLFAAGNPAPFFDKYAETTFSNKTPAHGDRALGWRYDNRIHRWFELWGNPLNREGLGGVLEKCIVQTNWCNTEGHHIEGSYYAKLSDPAQVDNFLFHISELDPALIIFMGSVMIDVLQNSSILARFSAIVGRETNPLRKVQKEFPGRRFKVGFQSFQRCSVVSLPHPSSSRGLSDSYIALFGDEIGNLISSVRCAKSSSDSPNNSLQARRP